MPSTSPEPQSTPPESPPTLVKEAAVEASFGCILRLKNAVNDEFLQDLLRKVQAAMATYHFVENCTLNMSQPYLDEIISKLLRFLQVM
ncbi:hypothetical protein OIU77_004494 [Salix suchowensis]|uniref:Uncharacterized protein n=1 Tax=Salix suchowensis TaxID=1278906 RepID=A0ABQ9AW63_9ROSI|nr:hypothetical protein OIU77_004494 [Salix suchowensis]